MPDSLSDMAGLDFLKKKLLRTVKETWMPALFSCSAVYCLQTDLPLWGQRSSGGNYSKTDLGKANCGCVMKYSWSPREVFKSYYICFGKGVKYTCSSGRVTGVLAGALLTLSSHHLKIRLMVPFFPFWKNKVHAEVGPVSYRDTLLSHWS